MCPLCDAGNKPVSKSSVSSMMILDHSDSKVKTMLVSSNFKNELLEACKNNPFRGKPVDIKVEKINGEYKFTVNNKWRSIMRYFFQVLTMLTDVTFFAVMGLILWVAFQEDSPLIRIVWVGVMIAAVRIWIKEGGFMAWKPSEIKKFMENAKRMGL